MPQRAAAVVKPYPMWKLSPGKVTGADHVVQKLDQFIGDGAHLLHLSGLLDCSQMLAHVMNTARRRTDDVVVSREIARKDLLRAGRFGLGAAVRHWLAAAGLLLGIVHLDAEALKQFKG